MQDHQRPDLDWRGDVPVATRFDDPYYSLDDGLAETRYVYVDGNGLPDRFRPGFRVAELGFGTGLSCLSLWSAWRQSGTAGALCVTSFEAYPMTAGDMRRALALVVSRDRGLARMAEALAAALASDASGPLDVDRDLRLELIRGDARQAVPRWTGHADAWVLDGFAPARNPEMWEPALLAEVAAHTAPGGTCATYTAAGHVRRALADAGFVVQRRAGYGRKRHMTVGRLPD